jgi:tetratricopeptide (TPR) repeat protein
MKNLMPITVIFLATALSAQESELPTLEIEPTIDPVSAEVFADGMVAPGAAQTETDAFELQPEPVHVAPSHEQTVPVAEEAVEEPVEQEGPEPEVSEEITVQLPADVTAEKELVFQYDRYVTLVRDGVFDEAESVAKRVVELTIKIDGPQSTSFSKALTNLALVQHHTGQYDAAQQNFQSAIDIIETNEDRLNGALVNPLKGLGTAQLELGRPDMADLSFRRAVHVSHVNNGPHNLSQISALESLAETHMRLGSLEEASRHQDMIYALNERAFSSNPIGMIPSLMRRADWQLHAGLVADQRTTLRRAIRIIEDSTSSDDLQLVEPLTRLGQSHFYVVVGTSQSLSQETITSGEIYFKRALRIASQSPDPDWEMIAETSLALGDYYMFQGNEQRARKVYKSSWQNLSVGEDRLAYRAEQLEQVVPLRENPIQTYIKAPSTDPVTGKNLPVLQGVITIAYDVSSRGRATNLKIVESQPAGFTEMERLVQRAIRGRIYRPRFVDGASVVTDGQILVHRFFYQQTDLDALQGEPATTVAETDKT